MSVLFRRTGSVAALCLAGTLLGQPPPARGEPPSTRPTGTAEAEALDELRRKNLASFDFVWKTIHDSHYDASLNGVDWEGAREEYRPKVQAAESVEAARGHMQAMIDLLGQSHMAVIPAQAYEALAGEDEEDTESDGAGADTGAVEPASQPIDRDGETGMRLRLADIEARQVLVVDVKPGSGAEAAGVKPGWQLVRIGKSDVPEMVGKIVETLEKRGRGKPEMYASFAAEKRMRGPVGETIEATFLDGEDQERTVKIPLQTAAGEVARLGALPPMRVDFESRRIEQEVDGRPVTLGYIGFTAFLDPPRVMKLFGEAMADFTNPADPVDGVVLDVRGNVGGIVMMVPGMAGYFLDQQGLRMGTLRTRGGDLNLVVFPRPANRFPGPLAVLTDTCSVSAAELLAGGLQAVGRARVFGTATAGEALPAQFARLANGDGFLFVFADYTTSDDQRLEGDGVLPDERVPYDRAALLAGEDPMIGAAARWVAGQMQAPEAQ